MADFKTALWITGRNEGGWVNDETDRGGETYCGISRRNFPKWSGWQTLDDTSFREGLVLPELDGEVTDFYKANFWDVLDLDNMPDQDLANQVYDMAVNSGVGEARKLLSSI